MSDIRQKLLVVFQAEARDHLARIRSILGKEGTAAAGANLDEVFRRAHSLKGAARAVDLQAVEALAHPLETLFARIREGSVRFDGAMMNVVNHVLDEIEENAASQVPGQAPAGNSRALQAIQQVLNSSPASKSTPSIPATQQAQNAAAPTAQAVLAPSAETVRINTDTVDRLHRSAGQLNLENQRQDLVSEGLSGIGSRIGDILHEWELVRNIAAAPLRRMSGSPELAHLSRYIEFVAHQVSTLEKETRALSLLQQRSKWSLRKLGERLQQDVRGARLILAEQVFDGFGKMMRDLARDEGKEIEFRVSGLDLEVDRLVLQALKDPIMHLLRNTLAHGIESPAERRQAGKKPVGCIVFRLEAHGNRLDVIVEDDGRGIDLQQVTDAAIKKRLLSESEAAALKPEERLRIIFHPGFSTARAVTSLSGRGMGLNIVAEAVAQLQGSVNVEPARNAGTRFIVSVPLSISTHRLLLVKCRGQTFALASHAVMQLHRINASELLSIEGRPAVRLHGVLIPLASMAQLLKIGEPRMFEDGEIVPVIVLKSAEKNIAVAVDALVSQIDGVIKELNPIIARSGRFSGGILMGDGAVVLVLNASELIAEFQRLDGTPWIKTGPAAAPKRKSTILVVDDSMTTRSLEKSILEAHGYQVLIAVDGIEALAQLRAEAIDLVVSDIEMPRLDGFGLLEEIKKDARLARIPVVMVTSLEKREDKERGLALGADGYIVKRKFDQKDLVDTVRQML